MRTFKAVLIDDEPWTREVIKKLGQWQELGIEVAGEASDGEYGLEVVRQIAPDIILTDVNMSGLSGIDLLQQLRMEGNQALVIFISGYDNYEFIRGALRLDAMDYLLKPIKADELNNQLRACVNQLKQKRISPSEDFKGDFLNVELEKEYDLVRNQLVAALSSNDSSMIKIQFRNLSDLLQNQQRDTLTKGDIVYIYYTLMNALQRYILGRNYDSKELFLDTDTTFAFRDDCTVSQMLDFVEALYVKAHQSMQELMKNRNKINIEQVKQYAQKQYTKGVTLEQTAAEFYVTKEYLSKTFKAVTGKGYTEYVTSLRMERAKELIVSYKIPLKSVGEMIGYVDQAHFYKTFKKYHGKTPGEMNKISESID